MQATKFTVNNCTCPLFGRPKNLAVGVLPTFEDVIRCCLEVRQILGKQLKTDQEVPFSTIAENVANKIIKLYNNVSIPCLSFVRVVELLKSMHAKYRKFKKYNTLLITKLSLEKSIIDYQKDCKKLFDIACCKCKSFNACNCIAEKSSF